MDTDLLVDDKVDDGQRLLNILVRDQFEIAVAFWAKRSEEGLWHLWIASSAIDANDRGEGLSKVYAAMDKIPDCQITPMDISLIDGANPAALDAIALRDRHPRRFVRIRDKRLGSFEFYDVYIYPRRFPWEVRPLSDGRWEVLISEPDDQWLTCESEEDARSVSAAPVLEYEAMARLKTDSQFVAELEKTASVMEKYRLGFGSRRLRGLAHDLRV